MLLPGCSRHLESCRLQQPPSNPFESQFCTWERLPLAGICQKILYTEFAAFVLCVLYVLRAPSAPVQGRAGLISPFSLPTTCISFKTKTELRPLTGRWVDCMLQGGGAAAARARICMECVALSSACAGLPRSSQQPMRVCGTCIGLAGQICTCRRVASSRACRNNISTEPPALYFLPVKSRVLMKPLQHLLHHHLLQCQALRMLRWVACLASRRGAAARALSCIWPMTACPFMSACPCMQPPRV